MKKLLKKIYAFSSLTGHAHFGNTDAEFFSLRAYRRYLSLTTR